MMAQKLLIGICGAGIGGLAAAIAMANAGAKVTVLEAAPELGEIGAGIQMTPNVARLLIKWGVSEVIGDNLVEFEELNMRRRDGTPVGYTRMIPNVRENLGFPWWLVHRMHLHEGLVTVARRARAELVIDARVVDIDWTSSKRVTVTTARGQKYTFDLLVGADGVKSIVRRKILPHVKPAPPTGNCAYRAIVPYSKIRADPELKGLVEKLTMEVWMADKSYIISYPISAGKDFNMVLSHHRPTLVDDVEEVDINEVRETYKDYDPRIKKIVNMVPSVKRWPLLVTGPLDTWSTPEKNVVLMG
jgi:salicylate hydroxylase